jgi:hypothetical protein
VKKKKFKKNKFRIKYRNAAPAPARNAIPRAPRAARPADMTPLKRLGYTAAGAAGTALLGSFLAREGWAPKTIATALTAVGTGLAWKGDAETTRSLGAGTMSAAGSQLALMMIDERGKPTAPLVATAPAKRQAGELPEGALERAFDRARMRLANASES